MDWKFLGCNEMTERKAFESIFYFILFYLFNIFEKTFRKIGTFSIIKKVHAAVS